MRTFILISIVIPLHILRVLYFPVVFSVPLILHPNKLISIFEVYLNKNYYPKSPNEVC